MHYALVSSNNKAEFQSQVNAFLQKGYTLHGNLQVTYEMPSVGIGNMVYTQAMIQNIREN